MNKNADECLVALLQAKEKVAIYCKEKVKNKAWQPFYNGIVENLDNIIVDYTISTKMSEEEILDCLFEIGADDKKSIYYEEYCTIKKNM